MTPQLLVAPRLQTVNMWQTLSERRGQEPVTPQPTCLAAVVDANSGNHFLLDTECAHGWRCLFTCKSRRTIGGAYF